MNSVKNERKKTVQMSHMEDISISDVEEILTDVERNLQSSTIEQKKQLTNVMYKKDINEKIMGIVYGTAMGEISGGEGKSCNVKQVLAVLDSYTMFGQVDLANYLKLLSDIPLGKYVKSITGHSEYFTSVEVASSSAHDKYMNDQDNHVSSNTPLIRSSIAGIFKSWDDDAVSFCMCTHTDNRCIAACVVYSSVIRNMILGHVDGADKTISEIVSMLEYSGNISSVDYLNELKKWTNSDHYTKLEKLKLDDGDVKYVYKCLSASLWGLNEYSNRSNDEIFCPSSTFKDIILAVTDQGGDNVNNCSAVGAMVGCSAGFSNLPLDWVDEIPNRKLIDDKVLSVLKRLSLVDQDASFNDIPLTANSTVCKNNTLTDENPSDDVDEQVDTLK